MYIVFCNVCLKLSLSLKFYKEDEEKNEDDEEEAVEDLAVDVEDADDEVLVVEGGSEPHTKSNLIRSFLDAIFD